MVLVLEKEDKWVYFVYVQFHAVTTWSMNCYFTVTIIKNDGHFHWVANLPHFHDCKSTCLVFILKPCDITGVFHCLNHVKPLKIWSCYGILLIFDHLVGFDSWYKRAKEHTWLIVQPWKVLNSTTTVVLKSPWIWFRSLKSTWFLY